MFRTSGIHHITAFVDDAQKNVDFYAGVLALRLVKKQLTLMHRTCITCITGMNRVHRAQSLPFSHSKIQEEVSLVPVRLELPYMWFL